MTAIATWRHPFSELLVNSGAQTWQETLRAVRRYGTDDRKLMKKMTESMNSISETLNELGEEFEPEKLQKILEDLSETSKRLERIESAMDQVQEFFLEYSPERMHKRVLLENALDAQADKLLARYSIEKERGALVKGQKTQGSPASEPHFDETAALMESIVRPLAGETSGELDLAELDREDSDVATDVLGEDEDWAKPQSPKGEDEDD